MHVSIIIKYFFKFWTLKAMKEMSTSTKDSEDFRIYIKTKAIKKQKFKNKIQYVKIRYWSEDQNACFLLFWINEMLARPLQTYSFDAPLKRTSFFKNLSLFITKSLGIEQARTHGQCKSKFSTIKRQIQCKRQDKKIQVKYDLIHYITDQADAVKPMKLNLRLELPVKVHELRQQMERQSKFMEITKELTHLHRGVEVQEKNNSIMRYLQQETAVKK